MHSEESKPRADVTRSPNQGNQWPEKNTYVLQKFLKKEKKDCRKSTFATIRDCTGSNLNTARVVQLMSNSTLQQIELKKTSTRELHLKHKLRLHENENFEVQAPTVILM